MFDINTLMFKLGEHYASVDGQMISINKEDGNLLFDILHTMSEYYETGEGYNYDKTGQLSVLYGELAYLYDPSFQIHQDDIIDGHTNDYEAIDMDDAELQMLYD